MRKSLFSIIVVPLLVLAASAFFWSGLNAIGFFNKASALAALALPFCIYSGSIIIWILNPVRWDIVPVILALSTTLCFLVGSGLLSNFVGLGFNPIPVFDIFFTAQGLNQTLPYFLDKSDSLDSNRTIFQFLISPVIAGVAGLLLGCLFQQEKSGNLSDRARKGGIRLAIVAVAFAGLFLGARGR